MSKWLVAYTAGRNLWLTIAKIDYSFIHSEASHGTCSVKKVVLTNFAKFTGEHLYQSLFFNKVAVFTEHLWTVASVHSSLYLQREKKRETDALLIFTYNLYEILD